MAWSWQALASVVAALLLAGLTLLAAKPDGGRLKVALRPLRRLAADHTLPRGVRIRSVCCWPDFIPVLGYAGEAAVIAFLRSTVHRAHPLTTAGRSIVRASTAGSIGRS